MKFLIKQRTGSVGAVIVLVLLFGLSPLASAQLKNFVMDTRNNLSLSSIEASKYSWSKPELISWNDNDSYHPKNPAAALRRSFLLPGWGEYYANPVQWTRGQWHMALDVSLILSYVGIRYRGSFLEDELVTFAQSNAGIDLMGRDREVYLAVSNHDNLALYNDYQLRTRNWNKRLEEIPENEWNWESSSSRSQFNDMRERVDKNNNQLPALVTLMVVNRVISGIHAFGLVRDANKMGFQAHLGLEPIESGASFSSILGSNATGMGTIGLSERAKAVHSSWSSNVDRLPIEYTKQQQAFYYTVNFRLNF
ncbi:MAG: hypothetical protein L7R84_01770 [Balneolaceae bacterium]|jgi:hypothetical protein|nr:hypothetical protein [Balneolaceae bacterium]